MSRTNILRDVLESRKGVYESLERKCHKDADTLLVKADMYRETADDIGLILMRIDKGDYTDYPVREEGKG